MSSGVAAGTERTLVVRHGTLIDGSGRQPVAYDALVIPAGAAPPKIDRSQERTHVPQHQDPA